MSDSQATATTDLIRWTLTTDPARLAEVQGCLADLGPEVHALGDGRFSVLWEGPMGDLGEVFERLWAAHGGPFEVTHEEFRRGGYFRYLVGDEAATRVA